MVVTVLKDNSHYCDLHFIALYQSARLRSLPLSMSGILLGSAIAYGQGAFRWDIFLLALLTYRIVQVLSDYANDYGDAQKGTDNEHRIGPKRAIQTGAMSLGEMKRVSSGNGCAFGYFCSFTHCAFF